MFIFLVRVGFYSWSSNNRLVASLVIRLQDKESYRIRTQDWKSLTGNKEMLNIMAEDLYCCRNQFSDSE